MPMPNKKNLSQFRTPLIVSSSFQSCPLMAEEKEENPCLQQPSSPHDAIFFVFAYLPVLDHFAMARVCRSTRDAVKSDIIPWLKIMVDRPLSCRLSDNILMDVVSKANGRLQALALISCVKITDDGLLRVVKSNPNITELHLPGCTSLSPEGVIQAAKLLRLKSLKISGIYFTRKEHLASLHNLIAPSIHTTQQKKDRILYHEYMRITTSKSMETNCPIDVNVCPGCDEVRMVFDCPRVLCGSKCRGCSLCIERCVECGACIRGGDPEVVEASCEDILCLECWLKLPKCCYCNNPYCSRHADQKNHTVPGCSGFICTSCNLKLL